MTLKPWRELITPHKDVLDGTFKQSEFAADLSQVQSGAAPDEYTNPEKFFQRTYITEGMRLLLISVAQRISGKGGDPVIQLQTSFGGGKTHALLAVYHLARRESPPVKLQGVSPVLDQAGVTNLPQAKVVIIDGNNISPSTPRKRGQVSINTLCGEIAWQLLGEPGFQIVAAADRDGTSPGKEALIELIKKAAPCVILLDELVAFIRQLESGKSYVAGTFESNLSFIQALTEAMKAVPNALLLASLPESEIETVGPMGKLALDSLEKYFGRVESVWKPVGTEEAFEIVKRRLFDGTGKRAEIERVCKTFFDFYIENNSKFPAETQTSRYHERLLQSYPIHPEVFDRLYSDWATLEKFQRTRGVLQYLAIVIHRLWNSDNRDPIIMPGSLPLEDVNVRTKSIHYLPQGWEPVIESEVDGPRSQAFDIDGKEPRLGAFQAARRVARTVFLGSAPSTNVQGTRGLSLDHVLLGSAQPGQVVAVYEDALKRLRDRLQYMFGDADSTRVWFDTRPNLRREMESRKNRLDAKEHVLPCIGEFLSSELRGKASFSGIHIFTPSADIPDEIGPGPRLVALEPDAMCAYSRANSKAAFEAAQRILEKRGEQPRQRRNRLLFLAADYDSLGRLRESAKTYLAWKSISDDIEEEKLNLDMHSIRQAEQALEQSERVLGQSVKDCYKWILNPFEEMVGGKPTFKWEVATVSPGASHFVTVIENKLKEEEWVIHEWAPIHLSNLLKQWYFKEGTQDVVTRKIFNDMASYIYMPRLLNEEVLKAAILQGVMSEEFFGYAQGKEGSRYLGMIVGSTGVIKIDESSVVIERNAAVAQRATAMQGTGNIGHSGSIVAGTHSITGQSGAIPFDGLKGKTNQKATRFFATKELNAKTPKIDFATVMDKVLIQVISRHSTHVGISIEINALDPTGFDDEIQTALKESCQTLGFKQVDFSDE